MGLTLDEAGGPTKGNGPCEEVMIMREVHCWRRKCRWFVGIAHQEGPGVPICGAFPDGIHEEIAYGKNTHCSVMSG